MYNPAALASLDRTGMRKMPNTRRVGWMGLAIAALLLAPALAAAQTAAAPAPASPFTTGKAASGEAKAALCSACHGPQGNSVNPEWRDMYDDV